MVSPLVVSSYSSSYSGNGDLTYEETKSHFTAWALMKSPLLIGTNVRIVNMPFIYGILY